MTTVIIVRFESLPSCMCTPDEDVSLGGEQECVEAVEYGMQLLESAPFFKVGLDSVYSLF